MCCMSCCGTARATNLVTRTNAGILVFRLIEEQRRRAAEASEDRGCSAFCGRVNVEETGSPKDRRSGSLRKESLGVFLGRGDTRPKPVGFPGRECGPALTWRCDRGARGRFAFENLIFAGIEQPGTSGDQTDYER